MTGEPWTPSRSRALLASPLLACNYHRIPPENRGEVEVRLRRLITFGASLDLETDVRAADGARRARIVVGFYDGFRDAGLFGADLCHRLGIRAYFFPVLEPLDPARSAHLSDADLADIGTVHEIGFHTASHRSAAEVTAGTVEHEVDEPVHWITGLAGRPPRVGAWRGGARFDDSLIGNRRLRELGVRYLVSNWSVEVVAPSAP